MVEFVGYNDARAIKAYNKKNLTMIFTWFGIICFAVSVVAIAIPLYELLLVWAVYLFLAAIFLFAMSFGKYDEKGFKELNIKTKHVFKISDLKIYRDGKEIKDTKKLKVYPCKTYIFLESKKAYYYVPSEENVIPQVELVRAINEVIHQIDISQVIDEVKKFVNDNEIGGEFTYGADSIAWVIETHRYTYHIDFDEVYVQKDKLTCHRFYRNITHYHISVNEMIGDIEKVSKKYMSPCR